MQVCFPTDILVKQSTQNLLVLSLIIMLNEKVHISESQLKQSKAKNSCLHASVNITTCLTKTQ